MSYTLKLENGRRVHVSDLSEEEINKTENRYNSMVCHVCHKDEEHSVPKHSLGGFILGAGIGTILANSILTKQYNKQKARRTKSSGESSEKKTSTKSSPKAAATSNKKTYLPNGLVKSIDTTSKKRITNKDIVDGVNLNEGIKVPGNNKYKKVPKNLSDKKLTDQTNYLPKRQISSVNTTYGRSFKREDLRDGAYIKKGVKFAEGGSINKKDYYVQYNVGKVKYLVNYYDGKKTHKDGSEFYDIATFNNKKDLESFIAKLSREGYKTKYAEGGKTSNKEVFIEKDKNKYVLISVVNKNESNPGLRRWANEFFKSEDEAIKFALQNNLKIVEKYAEGGSINQSNIKVGDKFKNLDTNDTFYIDAINREDKYNPFFVLKSNPSDLPEVAMESEFLRYYKAGLYEKIGEYADGGEVKTDDYIIMYFDDESETGKTYEIANKKFDNESDAKNYARKNGYSTSINEFYYGSAYAKGGSTDISHYKVENHIFIDYMDAVDYCDKHNLSYDKIIKSKEYAKGGGVDEIEKITDHNFNNIAGFTKDPVYKKGNILVQRIGGSTMWSVAIDNKPKGRVLNAFTQEQAFKKVEKEKFADGGSINKDESPKIYVADLAAYNDGRLVGKWLDLTDYSDADDLMAAIQDLMSEFSEEQGETREEWAIHDYENFPSSLYSEYMGRDEFESIYALMDAAKDRDIPYEVLGEAMAMKGSDDPSEVADNYYGEYDSFKDFAYQLVDDIGISNLSNPDFYFDYEGFGSDERINMGSEEEEESGYEDLSDEDLGYELVEQMGGLEGLSDNTKEMYFDYDKFARDLEMDYDEVRMNGMSYIFFTSYKKGGVPGRYNTGRSWKMDRARHNSKESYEKPMDSRKSYKK